MRETRLISEHDKEVASLAEPICEWASSVHACTDTIRLTRESCSTAVVFVLIGPDLLLLGCRRLCFMPWKLKVEEMEICPLVFSNIVSNVPSRLVCYKTGLLAFCRTFSPHTSLPADLFSPLTTIQSAK
jgi:hypothetical protein